MSFFYIPVIIILTILVFQLTLKAKIIFNIKTNSGRIQISFLHLKIIDYQLSICSGCLRFTNKKGKNKYLPIELSKESIQEYTDFQDILFRKTYFKQIGVYFNFGLQNSASLSALVCGYVDIFSKIAYSIFKTKKSETKLLIKVYPNFNKNVIKIGFKAKISLSIYDLLWSFSEAQTKKLLRRSDNAK